MIRLHCANCSNDLGYTQVKSLDFNWPLIWCVDCADYLWPEYGPPAPRMTLDEMNVIDRIIDEVYVPAITKQLHDETLLMKRLPK